MSENKRQLVLDAFNNKPVSRVPVGFWFHFVHPETKDYRTDRSVIQQNVDGHKTFFEKFQPDFIKLMSDGFFNYPADSLKQIHSAKDASGLKPLGAQSEWITKQVELVQAQRAQFTYNPATFYNIFGPATSLKFLFGANNADTNKKLADLILEDKVAVKKLLDIIGQDLADLAKRVITEGGADGIYLSAQNIQDPRVTKELYDEVIAPSEKKILEAANSVSHNNILHICGYEGARNHLEWYKDYPANIINWAAVVEGVPLEEGKKIFNGKAVIGGFANTKASLLYKGNKEAIQQETRNILSRTGRTGVILGADCTVPYAIALEHLEWVREAAK